MRTGQASSTAKMVAFWRAVGDLGLTRVPGFSDPGARKLLGGRVWPFLLQRIERKRKDPNDPTLAGMRPWVDGIILRVSFIDRVIAEASPKQVVILGAGLDTRAWRLDALRGVRVLEVDHPATQAYKRAHLAELGAPLAELGFVPLDFTRDDLEAELAKAGHDAGVATLWIWEGVVMYLDDSALRATLAAIKRRSACGSTLLAHYHEAEAAPRVSALRKLIFSWAGEPQIGLRSREVMRAELTRAGFRVMEDAGLAEQAARVRAPAEQNPRLKVSRIAVATVD